MSTDRGISRTVVTKVNVLKLGLEIRRVPTSKVLKRKDISLDGLLHGINAVCGFEFQRERVFSESVRIKRHESRHGATVVNENTFDGLLQSEYVFSRELEQVKAEVPDLF